MLFLNSGNYLLSWVAGAFKKQSCELFLAEGTKYHQRLLQIKIFSTKQKSTQVKLKCFFKFRQLLTFPGSYPPSIISVKELNYCVRSGNRCDLLAIVTECCQNSFSSLSLFITNSALSNGSSSFPKNSTSSLFREPFLGSLISN